MVYRLDHNVSNHTWTDVERLKEHPQWKQIPNMRFNAKSPDPIAKNTTNTVKQGGNTTTTQKKEYYTVRNDRLQELVTENKVTLDRQTLTPITAYVYPKYPAYPKYPQQIPYQPRRRSGGTGGTTTTTFISLRPKAQTPRAIPTRKRQRVRKTKRNGATASPPAHSSARKWVRRQSRRSPSAIGSSAAIRRRVAWR